MKTISFDLDDVLCNFMDSFRQAVNKSQGTSVVYEEITDYTKHHSFFGCAEYPHQVLIRGQTLENCLPLAGSKEVLAELKERGYRVIIITARSWHPDGYRVTSEWLEKHDIPYDELHLTDPHKGKMGAYELYEKIDFHIDDSPMNYRDAERSPHVVTPVVMQCPWNREVCAEPGTLSFNTLEDFKNLVLASELAAS